MPLAFFEDSGSPTRMSTVFRVPSPRDGDFPVQKLGRLRRPFQGAFHSN